MYKFDTDTMFPQKIGLVTEELGIEDQLDFAGIFDSSENDIPDEVVGIYSPDENAAYINQGYTGTWKENTTAIHEGIHPLQNKKMDENGLDSEDKGKYEMLMEGQASKYTPGESSYPELEGFYELLMDGFEYDIFDEDVKKEYGKVYKTLKETEEVLEEADLEYTMEEFRQIDENCEDLVETYDFAPGNEAY